MTRDSVSATTRRLQPTLPYELRTAVRSLRRSPGFLATSVLSIALAIGAAISGFSVLDAVRLRALPFPAADRLVVLGEIPADATTACRASCSVSYATYAQVLRETGVRALDAIVAYTPGLKALMRGGDAIAVTGGVVSPNVFAVMGARPLLGRTLLPSDDRLGAPLVTVLSHALWVSQFGADPAVIGTDAKLSDSIYTIVGVMEPGFDFEAGTDFWLPVVPTLDPSTRPSIVSVTVFGRLAPGWSIVQLRAELATLETAASTAAPGGRPAPRGRLVADPLRERYVAAAQSNDVAFAAIVACILLIACFNVANLALARALHQQREFCIRAALGAGARRLARPVFAQNAVIVALGGVLGIVLASWLLALLRAAPGLNGLRPTALDYRLDVRAVVFAAAASAVACLLISVVPARLARAGDPQAFLRASAGTSRSGRGWARHGFVVAQIACATVLMVGAALMTHTVRAAARVDLGFEPGGVVGASPSFPHSWREPALYRPAAERILAGMRALRGVDAGALRAAYPLAPRNGAARITLEGSAEALPAALVPASAQSVSPAYFRTFGIPLVAGRDFNDFDRETSLPVAIVNRWAAERWWPGRDGLGRTLRIDNDAGLDVTATVVGVVADSRAAQPGLLFAQAGPELYLPYQQASTPFPSFFVHAPTGARSVVGPARELLVRLVPDRPVFSAILAETVDRQLGGVRRNALQIGGFAAVGLVLALIGVYGVLSFDVNRRIREIGIRGALGATGGDIARLVLADALALALAGVVLGVPAALAATRLLQSLLFQTSRTDPTTYIAVVAAVVAVALAAAYLPARRAARVSPLVSLRTD